jgi:RNA polymerase sigma-70 factor (ECF subfamily)
MEEPSDGELLLRFRGGDASAIDELVLRHQAALLRHARALLGEGRAYEDVVQEAFLKLVQHTPVMPPEAVGDPALERAHLASWLHRVTRNACMDVMRSETRRKRREEHVAAHDRSDGGIHTVEGQDTREAVKRGLECLPHDQREVLVLRLLGERSYREIAEITGKKVGTVGWLISVGLKALAVELEPLLGVGPGAFPDAQAQPARVGALDERVS